MAVEDHNSTNRFPLTTRPSNTIPTDEIVFYGYPRSLPDALLRELLAEELHSSPLLALAFDESTPARLGRINPIGLVAAPYLECLRGPTLTPPLSLRSL